MDIWKPTGFNFGATFSHESLTWQKVLSEVQSRFGKAAFHSLLIFSNTSGGIESYDDPVSMMAG